MREFTIKPDEGYRELKRRMSSRIAFLAGIVILALFVVPSIISGEIQTPDASVWLTFVLVTGVMTFTLFNGLKKQKSMLLSYKLIITEEAIIREMMNTPTITLHKKDVRDIVKEASGAFLIIGSSKINAIGVPTSIVRGDELELLLTEIKPLTIKTSRHWVQRYQLLLVLFLIGLLVIGLSAENKPIAVITGIIMLGIMIYSLVIIQMSKNVDTRTKRLSWMTLIPIISILYFVITKCFV